MQGASGSGKTTALAILAVDRVQRNISALQVLLIVPGEVLCRQLYATVTKLAEKLAIKVALAFDPAQYYTQSQSNSLGAESR